MKPRQVQEIRQSGGSAYLDYLARYLTKNFLLQVFPLILNLSGHAGCPPFCWQLKESPMLDQTRTGSRNSSKRRISPPNFLARYSMIDFILQVLDISYWSLPLNKWWFSYVYGTPGSIVVESRLFLSFYSPGIFLAIKSKWTMLIVHHLVDNWRNLQWWMKQGWVQEIRQIGGLVPQLFVKIFNEGFFTSGIFIDII